MKGTEKLREQALLLRTREATGNFGRALGTSLESGDVIALIGEIGAGKTTLTRAIAEGAGVRDDVTSPTFTLMHEYHGPLPLFHMDPYRLDRAEDLMDLGFEEYLQREGALVVEWADRIEPLLPVHRLTIRIELDSGDLASPDERERDLDERPPQMPQGGGVEGNVGDFPSVGASNAYMENESRRLTVVAEGMRHEQLLAKLLQDPEVQAMILRDPAC